MFWSIFTTALEPTLSKISEKWKIAARFARGVPPSGSPPDGGRQSQQKFLFLLVWRAQKSFSIKETIFAGFAFLLTQGRAASHPMPREARQTVGQKVSSPQTPLHFLPDCWTERIFASVLLCRIFHNPKTRCSDRVFTLFSRGN